MCLQWSCLKAVSVPAYVLGGVWGSTTTSALVGCYTMKKVPYEWQARQAILAILK